MIVIVSYHSKVVSMPVS